MEGALYYILKDEPNFLNGFETIFIENDFTDITHKQFVDEEFKRNNFKSVYRLAGGFGPCFFYLWSLEKINESYKLSIRSFILEKILYYWFIMPTNNNKLKQDFKELEEKERKVLSMYGSQINPNTWQTFMDMEKEIIKEMNKENNRKNPHQN